VERRKPAPDAYLEAVRRLGLPAARCAAVEDSLTGVAAASAAGLRVVAVPTALTRTLDYSAADLVVAGHPDISTELLGRLFEEGHHVAD
jgi:beta-phosphoglucomutase-like phosphatase (HAD superfamily)